MKLKLSKRKLKFKNNLTQLEKFLKVQGNQNNNHFYRQIKQSDLKIVAKKKTLMLIKLMKLSNKNQKLYFL